MVGKKEDEDKQAWRQAESAIDRALYDLRIRLIQISKAGEGERDNEE